MRLTRDFRPSEVGVIPEDWNVTPLAACCTKIADGEHLTPKRTPTGFYLLSARNVLDGRIDVTDVDFVPEAEYRRIRKRCDPVEGDVLISCSGSVGRVATLPSGMECVLVRSAAFIKPDPTCLVGRFAMYFLQSSGGQRQILVRLNQAAQANLFLNHIQTLQIPLPPSTKEQETIAAAIGDADALIDALEQLVAKKRQIKLAAMQELLTGQKRLPGFTGEWKVVRLAEIGETIVGLTYKPTDVRQHGVLVLRASNIQGGVLSFDDNVYVEMELPSRVFVHPGDILICVRNGSRDLIGKCALVDEQAQGMVFGAFMAVYRTPFHAYVLQQFRSDGLKRQIHEHLGATINQITNKSLNAFEILLPSDDAEQTAVASVLADMDAEIVAVETKLAKARLVKQGMMQELLTGKIRLVQRQASSRTHASAKLLEEVQSV